MPIRLGSIPHSAARLWALFQEHGIKLPNPSQNDLSLRDTPELQELIAALKSR